MVWTGLAFEAVDVFHFRGAFEFGGGGGDCEDVAAGGADWRVFFDVNMDDLDRNLEGVGTYRATS